MLEGIIIGLAVEKGNDAGEVTYSQTGIWPQQEIFKSKSSISIVPELKVQKTRKEMNL